MNVRVLHLPALVAALFVSALLAPSAQATPIVLSPGGEIASSNDTDNLSASEVEAILGSNGYTLPLNLVELYKSNVSGGSGIGSDEKGFAGSYRTTFSNTASDPEDALIEYVSGPSIECPDCFLLVKDGNSGPSQYIFDISDWDGLVDIEMTGFWPNNGAISHVSIFGNERGVEVPLPGTALLFGLGMLLLGASVRRAQ